MAHSDRYIMRDREVKRGKESMTSFIASLTEQRPQSELPLFQGSLHVNIFNMQVVIRAIRGK